MDENKNNNFGLDDVDELLGATEPENRPDLDFTKQDIENVKSIADDEPTPMGAPMKSEPEEIYIIDETSTSIVIEETPSPVANPVAATNYQAAYAQPVQQVQPVDPPKKTKKANSKIKGWQIAIIAVVGVITLWLAIFTVDHTLAANGLSPLFCKMTQEYEDGSQSFVGLGYKIQFQFDKHGDLTQKCVPIWKQGPNDTKFAE